MHALCPAIANVPAVQAPDTAVKPVRPQKFPGKQEVGTDVLAAGQKKAELENTGHGDAVRAAGAVAVLVTIQVVPTLPVVHGV